LVEEVLDEFAAADDCAVGEVAGSPFEELAEGDIALLGEGFELRGGVWGIDAFADDLGDGVALLIAGFAGFLDAFF
jgi:hypothetical protein